VSRLAILAGSGALPQRLAELHSTALVISFAGVAHAFGAQAQEHAFEKMGALYAALKEQGVGEVVMAGAMSRPPLDPNAFDTVMIELAPRLIAAMQGGDDALLGLVIAIFEEQGFVVRGAHELDPSLTAKAGVVCGHDLGEAGTRDVDRAVDILSALSPLDVGQGAVVENGLCLGIETLQGTDALLSFVAETPEHLRKGSGVFVKAPKRGQDLRVDMPTIGPDTVSALIDAKISTLVIAAGSVIILDREKTIEAANSAGLSIIAQDI